jgi:hypothetical protein
MADRASLALGGAGVHVSKDEAAKAGNERDGRLQSDPGRYAIAPVQAVVASLDSALPMVLDLLILLSRCAPDVVGSYFAGWPAATQLGRHSTRASWLG